MSGGGIIETGENIIATIKKFCSRTKSNQDEHLPRNGGERTKKSNEIERLIQQDAATRVKERALVFRGKHDFDKALEEVARLSHERGHPVPFRPLGGERQNLAIVPEETLPALETLFRNHGIDFEVRRVRSVGELSREERRDLKKTGHKLG